MRFYGREISRANKERLLIVTFPVDDDPANILISRVIFFSLLFFLYSLIRSSSHALNALKLLKCKVHAQNC